ncbi:MAG: class I tRNA ligase family protein, partial [Bacilli bacterium]|nr:class I tRNA ligase family protein [Bacilli bacterium]
GSDIIFFWVARMAFMSRYLFGVRPFKDVILHGMIRDEIGRKVTKSLNNGADMMEVRDQYGMDSLRYFLTTTNTMGQDIRYADDKVEAAWNYINKIWNISRFIGIKLAENDYLGQNIDSKLLSAVDKWILNALNEVIRTADQYYDKYEFGEAAKVIYKFVWENFASWYLEMTKVVFNQNNRDEKINTCAVLNYVLTAVIKLLHPFIPFVTEEIYQMIQPSSITISTWPKAESEYDFLDAKQIEIIFEMITSIRNIRASKSVPFQKEINLEVQIRDKEVMEFVKSNLVFLKHFSNYRNINLVSEALDTNKKTVSVLSEAVLAIPLHELVNIEEELAKLYEAQKKMIAEIERCERLLNNPGFVNKAPEEKNIEEKNKLSDYQRQLAEINKLIGDYLE